MITRALPDREHERDQRVHLIQGQFHVSADPKIMLTTTLGSCVAACLFDTDAGIGGMNHFLLPEGGGEKLDGEALRYGAYAMEVLVNGLVRAGARRYCLAGKLFGGARLSDRLEDIGGRNADFAQAFLKREGIAYLGGSLRGTRARRLQFWPATGRVRQLILERSSEVIETERMRATAPTDAGAVDWFGDE